MTGREGKYVCPAALAGVLDFKLRNRVHNPHQILAPHIEQGMTVLDVGCGPGFFTLEMARLVGSSGRVIATDLQGEMLEKLKIKIQSAGYTKIIDLHQCETRKIGLTQSVDFILVFYMLHEVPDPVIFLKEIKNLLNPGGKVLIVEPKFHVTSRAFIAAKAIIRETGFTIVAEPKIAFSRAVLLQGN